MISVLPETGIILWTQIFITQTHFCFQNSDLNIESRRVQTHNDSFRELLRINDLADYLEHCFI